MEELEEDSEQDAEKACNHARAMCVRCGFCKLCHNRRHKRRLPGWKHEFMSRADRQRLRLHGTVVSLKHSQIAQELLLKENAMLKERLVAAEYGYNY